MADPRDYKLDVPGLSSRPSAPASAARPFLSVLFACCGVYQRIYRSRDGTEYCGACPRCGRPIRFAVGSGGTDQRSFVVE
jgi:hypothetical protein